MHKRVIITVSMWLVMVMVGICGSYKLEDGFRVPPPEARPHTYWFWMGGNVTKEGITADLEAMQRVGVGGVLIHNIKSSLRVFSADYMSPEWFACLQHAVAEADRLGLKVAIHNRAGWTGSGGPWIKPEYAMQTLVWSETKVKGPVRFEGVLPQPETRHGFYRDVAVQAVRTPSAEVAGQAPLRIRDLDKKTISTKGPHASSDGGAPTAESASADCVTAPKDIVDLTSRMATDGRVDWNVPEGEWTILRFGHTVTEGSSFQPSCPVTPAGLECDKLSRAGLDQHWNGGIKPLLTALGSQVGKTFVGLESDSYEAGAQNWTSAFPSEFKKRRGYSILPWLAAYTGRVIGSVAETERVLGDTRRTVEELFADNYYGYFAELCRKHKLQFMAEAYGGSFDAITCGGRADLPMGEFWNQNIWADSCKGAASAAHQFGRPVVGAESFTAHRYASWCNDPYSMKPLGDAIFALGVNRFYFSTFAQNPWVDGRKPGMTMGPYGVQFNRGNTWWEIAGPWLTYLARCQYMLQQGSFVADVCAIPGVDASQWKRAGYDFDWTAEEIIAQLKVVDDRLVAPGGTSYGLLQWPAKRPMSADLRKKVLALRAAGGLVNGLEAEPKLSPWKVLGLPPDFEVRSPDSTTMSWIHRRTEDAEFYFVANPSRQPVTADCIFRVGGKTPELWYPETGRIEDALKWNQEKDGRTVVHIPFGSADSVFVVFRRQVVNAGDAVRLDPVKNAVVPECEFRIEKAVWRPVAGVDAADPLKDITQFARARATKTGLKLSVHELESNKLSAACYLHVEYTVNGRPYRDILCPWEPVELPAADTVAGGTTVLELAGPWNVQFDEKWMCPKVGTTGSVVHGRPGGSSLPDEKQIVTFDKLEDWTARPEEGIKFYSGTAVYRKSFDFPTGGRGQDSGDNSPLSTDHSYYLDLGRVKNLAEVKMNGRDLGVLWKPPFRVDVTDVLVKGTNTVEIRVTNLWPNRLIGDAGLPETNRVAVTTYNPYRKDAQLLESGLIGSVRLVQVEGGTYE